MLISKDERNVTVMVGGIGFEVHVPSGLLDVLQVGQEIHLYTRLLVRDDGWHIYGFRNLEDRTLFDMLLTVQGVGPRTAVGILSSLPVMEFYRAVLSRDEKALTRLPGIGKKTAGRIIVELRDKIGLPKGKLDVAFGQPDMIGEAAEALLALGYSRQEAQEALSRATKTVSGPDLETLLREALKYLARF
ncbi:MAG TPA: Holliday junction branch migration protein RuvA [Firmicutes bacterium]|nr:Holliday junction branch migration protein RuvA [Candidatus Fermentithermobacillaceae bacterium]